MLKYAAAMFFASVGIVSAQQLSMSDKLALRDNCKQDIQALCPGVKPGDGGLATCVRENKDKLSEQCSKTFAEVMAKRKN